MHRIARLTSDKIVDNKIIIDNYKYNKTDVGTIVIDVSVKRNWKYEVLNKDGELWFKGNFEEFEALPEPYDHLPCHSLLESIDEDDHLFLMHVTFTSWSEGAYNAMLDYLEKQWASSNITEEDKEHNREFISEARKAFLENNT